MKTMRILLSALALLLAACGPRNQPPPPASPPAVTARPAAVETAAATQQPSSTPEPSPLPPTPTPAPSTTPTPAPAVLIGAGDVAVCGDMDEGQNDNRTAEMVEQLLVEAGPAEKAVFIAGDVVYDAGTAAEYENCFGPSWGRFKDLVRPAPGNHDYGSGGGPYFNYFGAAAGDPGKGYYSFDLGEWHIVVLNSNCNDVACGPNSPQIEWLQEDLRAAAAKCTLAYWHHPRFSSGLAGDTGIMNPAWRALAENGAEIVIGGHDHNYERFAPLNAEGQPDPSGVRQFVVGTGGAYLRPFGEAKPGSEVRLSGTHGVIRFMLYPDRYQWQFFPQDDASLTDMGEEACHE